jgi:hypothetical protein
VLWIRSDLKFLKILGGSGKTILDPDSSGSEKFKKRHSLKLRQELNILLNLAIICILQHLKDGNAIVKRRRLG